MAQIKTQKNNASVKAFIDNIKNETRRNDSLALVKMMKGVSGKPAKMWGTSIVGFDELHYKYADGSDGVICKISFSPRAQSLVLYLSNFEGKDKLLEKLGKYRSSGGCLYINKLADVDLGVLEKLIAKAYKQARVYRRNG